MEDQFQRLQFSSVVSRDVFIEFQIQIQFLSFLGSASTCNTIPKKCWMHSYNSLTDHYPQRHIVHPLLYALIRRHLRGSILALDANFDVHLLNQHSHWPRSRPFSFWVGLTVTRVDPDLQPLAQTLNPTDLLLWSEAASRPSTPRAPQLLFLLNDERVPKAAASLEGTSCPRELLQLPEASFHLPELNSPPTTDTSVHTLGDLPYLIMSN